MPVSVKGLWCVNIVTNNGVPNVTKVRTYLVLPARHDAYNQQADVLSVATCFRPSQVSYDFHMRQGRESNL